MLTQFELIITMSQVQLIIIAVIVILTIILTLILKKKDEQKYIIKLYEWNMEGSYEYRDLGARFKSYDEAEAFAVKHISGKYMISPL